MTFDKMKDNHNKSYEMLATIRKRLTGDSISVVDYETTPNDIPRLSNGFTPETRQFKDAPPIIHQQFYKKINSRNIHMLDCLTLNGRTHVVEYRQQQAC